MSSIVLKLLEPTPCLRKSCVTYAAKSTESASNIFFYNIHRRRVILKKLKEDSLLLGKNRESNYDVQ